jgi:hypothetical protein
VRDQDREDNTRCTDKCFRGVFLSNLSNTTGTTYETSKNEYLVAQDQVHVGIKFMWESSSCGNQVYVGIRLDTESLSYIRCINDLHFYPWV